MTETRHPSPISTCSPFRPCSPRLLLAVPTWILATSCQSRGCCHGNQKRHLRRPKAVWLAMRPPSTTIWCSWGGPGLSSIILIFQAPA